MNVVVVESPTKAKTINKYLGPDYTVLASYGHVRDLPPKDGSVRPDEDFELSWQVDQRSEKQIKAIAQALKGADALYLATDPDREGEAISWHVREVLEQRKALKGIPVSRVVFHEVTKGAVLDAMSHPREIDRALVEAYLARRALDYLVGFTLSPVLWRKLPGSRSAGRVQSVALRLICEREGEIEIFKPQEFWTVEVVFTTASGEKFTARLTHLDGAKLDKFDLGDEAAAKRAADALAAASFAVGAVEKKRVKRHPRPPFTTSTLQQEASRKLRISASRTMRVAQQLYEGVNLGGETVGLITYMRTDSVVLSQEAIRGCRSAIDRLYGARYVPEKPRVYRTKAKNAQEAHEAIRPTDMSRRPKDIAGHLDDEQLRLYELIWKRTIASEMESAEFDQVAADIPGSDGRTVLRATGSTLAFDGFLAVYQEGRDDPTDDESDDRALPPLATGDALERRDILPEQHFTQPPPRYTEASLVKRLEELGIGRPSTYASIIEILKDRDYVQIDKGRFMPEDRGRVVTAFLESFFARYVQYGFTAELEDKLDDVSNGKTDWKQVLREFWQAFETAVAGTKELSLTQVIDALDQDLGPHFFPTGPNGGDPRVCRNCEGGRLGLKLGKFGAFIGCSNYPDCRYTRALVIAGGGDDDPEAGNAGPRELGTDLESGQSITLRKGPYGPYLQLGEPVEKGAKPKRVSIPKGVAPADVDLELARNLLSLPRVVGEHPETGKPIVAGLGRYGPYLQHDGAYTSLPSFEELFEVGLNRAVALIKDNKKGAAGTLHELGDHPADKKPVRVMKGRYGPYIKHGRDNAPIPKGKAPEELTLEEAVTLLAARKAKGGGRSKAGGKTAGRTGAKGRGKAAAPADRA